MIHLDTLASFAPGMLALVIGVPVFAALRRERPLTMRERIARDNAALLREAGLLYRVPTYDGHSGEARVR